MPAPILLYLDVALHLWWLPVVTICAIALERIWR